MKWEHSPLAKEGEEQSQDQLILMNGMAVFFQSK